MSNIFEAIQKGRGEISDALKPVLGDEVVAEEAAPRDVAAVQEVEAAPVAPAAEPEPEPEPAAKPFATVRTLPVKIYGSSPLLPFDDAKLGSAEQYRMLRTRLQHHRKQPRMVLVSSSGAGDGKSVTAINLAGALSLKIEENVLLLDGDCRRSNIHAQLGLPLSPGLSEVLNGSAELEESIIRLEQLPNLSVLTAGEPPVNPGELLDSAAWRDLAASLRTRFRYVIVDSPPVGSVADYDLLQAVCDGVILVARPDHTHRAALLASFKTVPEEKQLGLVMNCVSPWFLDSKRSYAGYY